MERLITFIFILNIVVCGTLSITTFLHHMSLKKEYDELREEVNRIKNNLFLK